MAVAPMVEVGGAEIPAIGLGTWPLKDMACTEAVRTALACGYRHVDTAAMYNNEEAVGAGLKASDVARDDYFLTTKVWRDEIAPGALEASAAASLRRLGVAHVDLLLIHWPNTAVAMADCIGALCNAKKMGLTKHIGVSNFPTALMAEALAVTTEPLVCNQIEYHPHLAQDKVLAAARAADMAVVSYCPLGRGDVGGVLAEPVVTEIAARVGRTAAQVVLRWQIQQDRVVAIPKSGTPARIRQNIELFDFELTAADMAAISALARPDGRVVNLAHAPKWD